MDDLLTWAASGRLLPHALAAAGHAEALSLAPEATGRLLNEAGLYLQGRARFAEARTALERALRIDEETSARTTPMWRRQSTTWRV